MESSNRAILGVRPLAMLRLGGGGAADAAGISVNERRARRPLGKFFADVFDRGDAVFFQRAQAFVDGGEPLGRFFGCGVDRCAWRESAARLRI